jgi:hypothetical protein
MFVENVVSIFSGLVSALPGSAKMHGNTQNQQNRYNTGENGSNLFNINQTRGYT